MKDEALKLALRLCEEALPKFNWGASCLDANAIQLLNTVPAVIKEALAQPAQEPIAYVTGTYNGRFVVAPLNPAMVLSVGMAFYTAPPAQEPDWKDQYEKQKRRAEMWIAKYEKDIGLLERVKPTQEPICDMGAMCLGCEPRNPDGSCPDARPPQEDEEVCSHCGSYCHERDELDKAEREIVRLQKIIDAPKREWVGLTDEEITKIINANLLTGLWDMAKEIEAKLKERNV